MHRRAFALAAILAGCAAPALAGNFEFVVKAEPGLDLRFIGYAADDAVIFEATTVIETREGDPAYVARVDEAPLRATDLALWCVEDRSGRWQALAGADRMLCDDQPSETRGSYRFTARADRPRPGQAAPAFVIDKRVPVRPEKLLVACIQTELNEKGFSAGPADGAAGSRTRRAVDDYRAQNPGLALGPLAADNLGPWCDEVARHEGKPAAVVTEGDLGALSGRVETLVRGAETALASAFDARALETITFYVSADAAWLADTYLKVNRLPKTARRDKLDSFGQCEPIAEFADEAVFVCTDRPVWALSDAFRQTVFGHEYFHALSGDQARKLGERACCYDLSKMGPLGPEWLKEGGAQYAGLVVAAELGLIDLDQTLRALAHELDGVDLDLAARNTRVGYRGLDGDKSEHVGVLATHILTAGAGRSALPAYYRYLGYGRGHPEAFAAAFGLTIDELQPLLDAFVAAQ